MWHLYCLASSGCGLAVEHTAGTVLHIGIYVNTNFDLEYKIGIIHIFRMVLKPVTMMTMTTTSLLVDYDYDDNLKGDGDCDDD